MDLSEDSIIGSLSPDSDAPMHSADQSMIYGSHLDDSIHGDEHEKNLRRSTRDSRRPKFDDELVDFNIRKRTMSESLHFDKPSTSYLPDANFEPGPSTSMEPSAETSGSFISSLRDAGEPNSTKAALRKRNVISMEERLALDQADHELEALRMEQKRREARIASKDIRAKELAAATEAAEALIVTELAEWSATDDIALITAVCHVSDLLAVHSNLTFSHDYSLAEIEERWYQLMYDDTLSRQAKKRMNELPMTEILRIQSKTVFSEREDELLATVDSEKLIGLETFVDLLRTYPEDFHSARTPQILFDRWHILKRFNIIPNGVPPSIAAIQPIQWDQIEKKATTSGSILDPALVLQSACAYEKARLELSRVLVEPIAGITNDDQFSDNAVIATLRGRVIRFLIKSDKIVLGRDTGKFHVDLDLALEGPSLKISRRQAIIEREKTGDFWVQCIGQRPMYVDGKTMTEGQKTQLRDGSVIEIALLRLVFRIRRRN